jgi:hypothetical protein
MVALTCKEHYPDIFTPIPIHEDPESGPTAKRNRESKILYLAVRHLLQRDFGFDPDSSTTVDPANFPDGFGKRGRSTSAKVHEDQSFREKVFFTSVLGILRSRGYDDPSLGKLAVLKRVQRGDPVAVVRLDAALRELRAFPPDPAGDSNLDGRVASRDDVVFKEGDDTIIIAQPFIEALTDAVKRHNANRALFASVFEVLQNEGADYDEGGTTVISKTLRARQLAEVTGRLIDDRVSPDDPHIRRYVITALTQSLGGGIEGSASDFDVDLPDLDRGIAVEIEKNNVRAVAAIYFSAMLEEMRLYAVAEKIVDHFMIGMVPIGRGPAGDRLYRWIKTAPERFTEAERRGVYGRVLGLAHGAATDLVPNREFSDLWIRFLSPVSLLAREELSTEMRRVSQEQVLKAGRDLGVNLSLHGFGIAHPAAIEMQKLINQIREMLSAPDLLRAYGVNDIWQLVDRVNQMYLGGYVNGVRYRTMAQAGANIILWIADNAAKLASVAPAGGINFLDPRLVNNVERWLAVTGTPDASVERYTDPVDLRAQPTVPAFAPVNGSTPAAVSPVVRGALEQVGIESLPAIPQA